jgi:hypothetical protein
MVQHVFIKVIFNWKYIKIIFLDFFYTHILKSLKNTKNILI